MLTLDDLLRLLSDSVELDILSSLFVILNFKIKSFLLVLDFLQISLEITYVFH